MSLCVLHFIDILSNFVLILLNVTAMICCQKIVSWVMSHSSPCINQTNPLSSITLLNTASVLLVTFYSKINLSLNHTSKTCIYIYVTPWKTKLYIWHTNSSAYQKHFCAKVIHSAIVTTTVQAHGSRVVVADHTGLLLVVSEISVVCAHASKEEARSSPYYFILF
jgi:hypothetical protein